MACCTTPNLGITQIAELLGPEAEPLLNHKAKVSKDHLHLPGPDWVDRIFAPTDRSISR